MVPVSQRGHLSPGIIIDPNYIDDFSVGIIKRKQPLQFSPVFRPKIFHDLNSFALLVLNYIPITGRVKGVFMFCFVDDSLISSPQSSRFLIHNIFLEKDKATRHK